MKLAPLALACALSLLTFGGCNAALEGLEISIQPDPVRLDEDLAVQVDAMPTADEDGEQGFAYVYAWSRDGEAQDGLDAAMVPWSELGAGETWSVKVTPTLGAGRGSPATAEVTLPDDPDHDGDGFEGIAGDGADCDDYDDTISPDATDEADNNIDEDCDGAADEPSFSTISATVFAQGCGCHFSSPAQSPAGLGGMGNYDSSYDALVGRPAQQLPSMNLVTPGDPEGSYLLHKLKGEQLDVGGQGQRMPLNGFPLSEEDIEGITLWIQSGAHRD